VIFRKTFVLGHFPNEAYAALAASQGFSLVVNGKDARPMMSDGQRNGRIAMYDLRADLIEGQNTIAIDVTSHTEKKLNDVERLQFPKSRNHLNTVSGVGFYLHADFRDNGIVELTSDSSWLAHRAPEGKWKEAKYDDKSWPLAVELPAGIAPLDEGSALPPIARKDFANEAGEIAATMQSACATAVQPGGIRASLQGSDALMTALDRPNREQVMTTRLSAATTLQALELTNGSTLDQRLKREAQRMAPQAAKTPRLWVNQTWLHTLGRKPTDAEMRIALEMLGEEPKAQNVADVLWAIVLLPEFQLIE